MHLSHKTLFLLKLLGLLCLSAPLSSCEKVHALSQKIKQHWFHQEEVNHSPPIAMVTGVKVIGDFAYGTHPQQRMDIYAPEHATNAPVIVMLHGGGWTSGEKNSPLIYINKVNRWVPKGFIVISVETRLFPEADVYTQTQDFAQAVASAQHHAADWGGDANAFILMGHSSGGTIVSVLSTNPKLVTDLGGKRWLATFSLDSSSLDVARTMRLWHEAMFQGPYGHDQKKWSTASPFDLVNQDSIPMFIACSTFRPDSACEQAQLFKGKAQTFNIRIEISPQKLNHGEMNDALGTDSAYTESAEAFMATLNPTIASLLKKP